jgi:GT2 family glycosyltransferase
MTGGALCASVRSRAVPRVAVVIPCWNGAAWLPGCLGSLAAQTRAPDEVVVVDNGSADDSIAIAEAAGATVLALGRNTGFAVAANRGIAATTAEVVALVNTDVELAPDWLEHGLAALAAHPEAGSVATRMVDLADPTVLYDAGDVLGRDGAAVQRGRFEPDDGRYPAGDVFAACAGAALYRRAALEDVGGFDERLVLYYEDVDLGLRLRLRGWGCVYAPAAVARHAGGGSSSELPRSPGWWVERNALLLVAKAFPARWLPLVAYRQAGWAWHARREGRLREHLDGARAALPLVPAMLRERRALRARSRVPIEAAVPAGPIRQARLRSASRARSTPPSA